MYDVITFGGASKDVFFKTDEGKIIPGINKLLAFEYGSKIIPESSLVTFGGGALNAAVNFMGFGLKVGAAVRVGKDETGEAILQNMKRLRISAEFVEIDPRNETGFSVLIARKGDHVAFLSRGASDHLALQKINKMKAKWFYISSLTGESDLVLPKIFEHAKRKKIKIAFNPGSVQLEKGARLKPFIEESDLLIVNKREGLELLRVHGADPDKEVVRALLSLGAKRVLVTDGTRGSYYGDAESMHYEPAIKVPVEESTGAGDCFASTFVACLIRGFDFVKAQKFATINSASVVTVMGAQRGLMTMKEIDDAYRRYLVRT